ncbi:hypothetical protein CCH79_00015697 [Gambusia affinis]|uniref:Uncharacterized protein n=1 Tax=Gambusia affinis TaxID=33528 RepID=A0A315W2U6_GAMAF|nr:hypothetical protein CCH79_00015697 [Gambusia affinis]
MIALTDPTTRAGQLKYEKCRHSSRLRAEWTSCQCPHSTPCCTAKALGSVPALHMSKINSGSAGCRAVVMAGKYLSGPGRRSAVLAGTAGRQRGQMCAAQCRTGSSTAASLGGRTAAAGQQESPGYFSAADRHALANRNLIYRDVKAFLSEVGGDPREARYWLAQFQRANLCQSPAFAVLEYNRAF